LLSSLSNNQRGIAAILGCMASYTVNDVLVKQILQTYPVGEVIFVRGVMCSLLIGAAALAFGHAKALRAPMSRMLTSRSLCDGLSTAGFIAALAHMKLANIAAVLQIAPLIITAMSVVLYREVVGWRRWTAIGVGFAGALLVIKPIPSEFNIWAIVAAASAVAAAVREIQTRQVGRTVPVFVVAFWGAVAITLCGIVFIVAEDWRMFAGGDLFRLFIAAFFVGIAIFLLALGFREVDLSVVAPFRYSYLLTSALGGFLVFREVPDSLTVAGAVLIVGSGIYTLHRESVRRRSLTGTATPAA
jgi:drug/metabolite transporter (DMT)-like permease